MSDRDYLAREDFCQWCGEKATNGAEGEARVGGKLVLIQVSACDRHAPLIADEISLQVSRA